MLMIMMKRFCAKKQTARQNDASKSSLKFNVMLDGHDLYLSTKVNS